MDSVPENEVKQPVHREKQSQNSQTASDFIDQQLALEADAREVLPYKFDKCTNILGALRQNVFACLTCSPPPASAAQVYTPAGVCYACSISCHGEHTLVELFSRRDFTCDCGTSRLPSTSPCTLRLDPLTGHRGVHSQTPAQGNHYNHNYQNRFCACGEEYDAETEKGTMFQCLGLGTVETGGCGEDWYHPECLMGLGKDWYKSSESKQEQEETMDGEQEEKDHPVPPGFPSEDDFDAMICYKCVEANPWIKKYAGTGGFLPPVFREGTHSAAEEPQPAAKNGVSLTASGSLKRKASESEFETGPASPSKRVKDEDYRAPPPPTTVLDTEQTSPPAPAADSEPQANPIHKHDSLPPAPEGTFSLFLRDDFRTHICHCPTCYPSLIPHPQLLDEESTYEPSLSSSSSQNGDGAAGHRPGHSHSSRASLLDRGEAALSNVDRVRAIEGVMVYNHLRDKVKEFLKPYAESGTAVSAEDIKAYFEKLRGDEGGIRDASRRPGGADDGAEGGGSGQEDNRREQSGY